MTQHLDLHAAGFVVRQDGVLDERVKTRLRRFIASRGLTPSDAELSRALADAAERYHAGASRLFVCAASPCSGAFGFDVDEKTVGRIAREAGVVVERTGCQGHCKRAPVVALRVGRQLQRFGQMQSADDRRAVFGFARDAAAAGSFVVPNNEAAGFGFDPVHRHDAPAAPEFLRFLVGRFRGEGRYAADGYTFHKELIGGYEAGGRFVSLRLQASYPLADGGTDVHRALILVGAERRDGRLTGHAYTDGGCVHEYVVERGAGTIEFDDLTPDHGRAWKRVRKIIRPIADGFEEQLAVDGGRGLEPYYTVRMQRVEAIG